MERPLIYGEKIQVPTLPLLLTSCVTKSLGASQAVNVKWDQGLVDSLGGYRASEDHKWKHLAKREILFSQSLVVIWRKHYARLPSHASGRWIYCTYFFGNL